MIEEKRWRLREDFVKDDFVSVRSSILGEKFVFFGVAGASCAWGKHHRCYKVYWSRTNVRKWLKNTVEIQGV